MAGRVAWAPLVLVALVVASPRVATAQDHADGGVRSDAGGPADGAVPSDAGEPVSAAEPEPPVAVPAASEPSSGLRRPSHGTSASERGASTPCPARGRVPDEARLGVGPRAGVSINGDQWILGGYGRFDGFCLGGCPRHLSLELQLLAGLGGNHLTLRASLRLEYIFWFMHDFGLYPLAGISFIGWLPVGHFATFCHRVDLEGCTGWDAGLEVGGGFRVWRLTFEAAVGVGGIGTDNAIPVLTITAGLHFPLWRSVT